MENTKKKKKKKLFFISDDTLTGYAFLGPNISGFLLFTLIPIVVSFGLAFVEWDLLTPVKFTGFANFIKLIHDKNFWYYLYNTFYFMLGIPLGMFASLALAILINQKLKGIVVFRTVFFLPVISSMVACAIVWRWIYNPDYGLLNAFLSWIGVRNPPPWIASTSWAKPALIIMGIWQSAGYNMLLYLAALQGIPGELYESAGMDGATKWQQFWYITWPSLTFVNFFIVIIGIINGFQAFGIQYVMTSGGPADSTTTIVYYIFNHAFMWFNMGYASAVAWALFIFMFGFTLLQWKLGKQEG
ncbi:MAG: hypothetical protein A2539_06940 [Elusimicrobia bacterium RIFOXYD2_FULL_34_15]|nr:MAG: hypothetical protein A2539_06940 [Elusimicrobia bacterium RIFOXYD2_FULL_34_15]